MTRDLSIEWKSLRGVVALGALVTLGCGSRGDAKPIDIRDFTEARPVNDSLKKLVPLGTPVPRAQALMEQSGFRCDPKAVFHDHSGQRKAWLRTADSRVLELE